MADYQSLKQCENYIVSGQQHHFILEAVTMHWLIREILIALITLQQLNTLSNSIKVKQFMCQQNQMLIG